MSTLMMDYEVEPEFTFDMKEVLNQVIDTVLSGEHFPENWQVSFTITDEAGIHELNAQFRDTDRATDVLSFPLGNPPAPYGGEEDLIYWDKDLDLDEYMLGDIVLCYEKVLSQAEEYGHSVKREFAFLVCHSVLHLLGYDHMEEEERQLMEEKQRIYMEQLHITREAE